MMIDQNFILQFATSKASDMSSTAMDNDDSNPPLIATYKHLLDSHPQRVVDGRTPTPTPTNKDDDDSRCVVVLPVIDLQQQDPIPEHCRASIVRAASEWGFFQVTNHGVPQALLDELHDAQVAVFRRPFQRKVSAESYCWGTPTATCLDQLSWSEAYHIPLMTSSTAAGENDDRTRLVIEEVSTAMWKLAQQLAGILVAELRDGEEDDDGIVARCTRSTCFLRLNRYPACGAAAAASGAFGLCPHTDSDFLTILHNQDGVGGLQLLQARGGGWVAVEPNPSALMVNVGDLLQAWSNDRYRSVEHRVMASAARERFSVAFFLCPGSDTLIRPRSSSSYRSFTFGEYRNQVREDVRLTGRKIGLHRFRLQQQQLQEGGGPL